MDPAKKGQSLKQYKNHCENSIVHISSASWHHVQLKSQKNQAMFLINFKGFVGDGFCKVN